MSYAITLAVSLGLGLAFWLASLRLRDAGIVDVLWGYGFGGIALVGFAESDGGERAAVVTAITVLWSVRLGTHLLWRSIGEPEDARYRAMREYHGDAFGWRSIYTVFGFQVLVQWFVSLPVQLAQRADVALGLVDALALGVFAIGFACEAVADWQLARFRADPANAGQVLDRGLWSWSRHPNYFGDSLVWWALGAMALAAPWGWLALASPALLTFFILRVSGVPMLEHGLAKRRPAYEDYRARTNAFFPGPPRAAS